MKNELEWNVLNYNWNMEQVVNMNIFKNGFLENLKKDYASKSYGFTTLKEYIIHYSKYHYWCRREYEIAVGDLDSLQENLEKIDVYRQIEMNIDRIVEYVNVKTNYKYDKKEEK
jgi:hypothetical protein